MLYKKILASGTNLECVTYYSDKEYTIPHREDGPAFEYAFGDKFWFINGKLHRKDGPAVEMSSVRIWYNHGKRHREDGPAYEESDGRVYYYLNNILYTEEDYWAKIKFGGFV